MDKNRKDKKEKALQKDTRDKNSNEEPMETDEINGDNQSLNNSGVTASGNTKSTELCESPNFESIETRDGKTYGSDGTLPVNDRQNNRTIAPDHDADLPTTSIAVPDHDADLPTTSIANGNTKSTELCESPNFESIKTSDGKTYGSDGTLPVNDRQNNRTIAPDHDADLPTTSIAVPDHDADLPTTSIANERKRPNEEMNYNYERSISHGIQYMNVQAQQQRQLQRSLEASKQMLYGVFGNVITILEEYEERELELFRIKRDMKVPKSDIYIPNQSHKTYDDIQSILECQLLLFETQTKVCPAEVLSELHEELKHRTLSWSAVRADLDIKEIQQTDRYIAQLYEILAKGCTFHQPINMKDVTAEVIKGSVQALMNAQQDCEELGREFKRNPDKKAINPKTRTSERIKEGSHRISLACGNKSLDRFLKADVKRIKKMHNVLNDDLK